MRFCNLATVSVPTTAGGTEILSSAAATAATAEGLVVAMIYPSVEIRLVDAGGNVVTFPNIPGAVVGTGTNSAAVCPAGQTTTVAHRSGALRAISPSGTATVAITLGTAP